METKIKVASIRCDVHPPLSAIMFCDACKSFLCRVCAEVRPGGRVCASCRKPCREPSAGEFAELIALRMRSKEDAHLAKAAESRIQTQLEKAKLDREARLKAEFAARKAALAQQQHPALNAMMSPATSAPVAAQQWGPPQFNALAVPQHPATGGTMYDPHAPQERRLDRDPLAKLGERSHLNVIGRAKNLMLLIGIITLIANIFWLYSINEEERKLNDIMAEAREQNIKDLERQIKVAKNRDERKELEQELSVARQDPGLSTAIGHGIFFIIKAVFGAYIGTGILLIGLAFMCEQFPRAATTTAFVVYLLLNLVSLLVRFDIIGIFFRWGAIVALYNGMVAGHTLHKMRLEEASGI